MAAPGDLVRIKTEPSALQYSMGAFEEEEKLADPPTHSAHRMAMSQDCEPVAAMSEGRVSSTASDAESEYIMKFSGNRRFLITSRDVSQLLTCDGWEFPHITASSGDMASERTPSEDSECITTLSSGIESIMGFSERR